MPAISFSQKELEAIEWCMAHFIDVEEVEYNDYKLVEKAYWKIRNNMKKQF